MQREKIYLSSTSVYGGSTDTTTELDELSPTVALSPKAKQHLRAEMAWRQLADIKPTRDATVSTGAVAACPWHVMVIRLAGIYGPSRSMLHTVSQRGISGEYDQNVLVCRVHVDDVVSALTVAALHGTLQDNQSTPAVINLVDDHPASRADVSLFASDLLKRCPEQIQTDLKLGSDRNGSSASGRARFRTSKRVSNQLMKAVLLPNLKYPSYREGLTAIAAEQFGLEVQPAE